MTEELERLKDIKEYLDYNPEAGVFTWIKPPGKSYKLFKKKAGKLNKDGYITIQYKGKYYLAHRLAWYFVHNSFPTLYIDHINGIKIDNRLSNLREVTNRENQQNQAMHRMGHLPGTRFHKRQKKWESRLKINKKQIYLGTYLTQQEAHEAYVNYIKENNL